MRVYDTQCRCFLKRKWLSPEIYPKFQNDGHHILEEPNEYLPCSECSFLLEDSNFRSKFFSNYFKFINLHAYKSGASHSRCANSNTLSASQSWKALLVNIYCYEFSIVPTSIPLHAMNYEYENVLSKKTLILYTGHFIKKCKGNSMERYSTIDRWQIVKASHQTLSLPANLYIFFLYNYILLYRFVSSSHFQKEVSLFY